MTLYVPVRCGPYQLLLPMSNVERLVPPQDDDDNTDMVFDAGRLLGSPTPRGADAAAGLALIWRSLDGRRRCKLLVDEILPLQTIDDHRFEGLPRIPLPLAGFVDGLLRQGSALALRVRLDACLPPRRLATARIGRQMEECRR